MREAEQELIPDVPEGAEFVPKHELPVLKDYSRRVFPEDYWQHWKKKDFSHIKGVTSWVGSTELRDLSQRACYQDMDKLELVCNRLDNGADIGCSGRGRLRTVVENSEKIHQWGERMGDALQTWIMVEPPVALGPLRSFCFPS